MARDATAASLTAEVAAARDALRSLCEADPERWWPAYELRANARNGWSSGAMNLALNRLVADGTFEAEGDQIRLRH